MSGSRWVIIPLWLSQSLRSFLYSSVYSCYLFFISSASVKFLPFLSFIMPIFAWKVLKRSLAFPILLFSSTLHCSFKKTFLSLLALLWNSAFVWIYLSLSPLLLLFFFSQLFVRPPQTSTLPSDISFLGMASVHHLLYNGTNLCSYFSGTLSTRSSPLEFP